MHPGYLNFRFIEANDADRAVCFHESEIAGLCRTASWPAQRTSAIRDAFRHELYRLTGGYYRLTGCTGWLRSLAVVAGCTGCLTLRGCTLVQLLFAEIL